VDSLDNIEEPILFKLLREEWPREKACILMSALICLSENAARVSLWLADRVLRL